MRNSQRKGDSNSGGGVLTDMLVATVFVNGRIKSVSFDGGTSHPDCPDDPIHCEGNWFTIGNSEDVIVEGLPATRTTDTDLCGHARIGGSPDVFVN